MNNRTQKDTKRETNIVNTELKECSRDPMTGFYRTGYCTTGPQDRGTHTVCAIMNKEFLDYTKSKGNNLYSVVKPGDRWCLCEYRWYESYAHNVAPDVVYEATNKKTNINITKSIFKK